MWNEMLIMRLKISLLLHHESILLENKQSDRATKQIRVFSSLVNQPTHPNPITESHEQARKPSPTGHVVLIHDAGSVPFPPPVHG